MGKNMKLIECVPNFSEGRNKTVIEAISEAIRSIPEVKLLDIDPGAATNRTVYTFAGEPGAVLEAAFAAIKKGTELIDMRQHKGEHSRQGACDVCPFIPIAGTTMKECVELSKKLAKRVGDELGIPVYLYAESAQNPKRKRLPDIRKGEYEGLAAKLKKPEWRPDFGPAKFNAKSGATVIGARNFLIAYNVNLNTRSVKLAKEIAFSIRESGRVKKDKSGKKVLNKDGTTARIPGFFKDVQATGWMIPEYGRAQVTINILDTEKAPLHAVFDKCCKIASSLGLRVTGSEIVGMVPKNVLTGAGRYFLGKQRQTTGVSEKDIIEVAIQTLGLRDVGPFEPSKKIIEECFMKPSPLASMPVSEFTRELGANSPAPGGGSVAALAGALSGALTSMVASLTHEKKGFEDKRALMEKVGNEAQELIEKQVRAIDDDTFAFNKVMDCFSMPKTTDAEKTLRKKAIEEANKGATLEPLGTLERCLPLLGLAKTAAEKGNPNSLSDAGVAALMARASAHGAYYNVLINLAGISDEKWKKKIQKKADEIIEKVDIESKRIEGMLLGLLKK